MTLWKPTITITNSTATYKQSSLFPMFITYEEFRDRADRVRAEIAAACVAAGRAPQDVGLLAVTKTQPAAAAEHAARYGLAAVGENRVQEGAEKRAQTGAAVRWELIGHLQSNKAKLAATHFDRIQSVDSDKLLRLLDRAAAEPAEEVVGDHQQPLGVLEHVRVVGGKLEDRVQREELDAGAVEDGPSAGR